MNELSQNVNIRISYDFKRKIMEESNKRQMRMSEYLIYIIQEFWNMEEQGTLNKSTLSHNSYEEELRQVQTQLSTKENNIKVLEEKLNVFQNEYGDFKNNYSSTVRHKAEELYGQWKTMEHQRLVSEIHQKYIKEIEKLKKFQDDHCSDLEKYETDLLLETFDFINSQYEENIVPDLPSLVNELVKMYYKQKILPTLNKSQYV